MSGGDSYRADRSSFNAERADRGQRLLAAALPQTKASPAVRHLVEHRGLPLETVLSAPDQLYLPSSARGRGPGDHALLTVLRVLPEDEPSGIQVTWIDLTGAPAPVTDKHRKRDYFAFVQGGCRDACWWGGSEEGGLIAAAEGFAEKPLALLAAGVPGRVVGFGSRSWLRHKSLAGKKLTIVADRAPDEQELAADGSSLRAAHLRDYGANVDSWLLSGFADRVWITPDPPCDCCKDQDDIWRRHGAEGVRGLLARAAQAELGRDGWITRLARIDDDLERQAAIKEAMAEATYSGKPLFKGIPIKNVRARVGAERDRIRRRTAAPQGDDGPVPWEDPIGDVGVVLDDLVAELERYIATTAENLDAAALWAGMTHLFDRLHCMPKLALQSPTKQCGKTTFLDCLSNVVRRPELVSGVTEAAFIRTSDAWQPTWLLDEADRFLNPKTAGEALTAAINASSYRRLAKKKICVPSEDGNGWSIQDFTFWCPMLLAGIRELVDTVQDRSIVLRMQRALPGELKHRLVNGTSPQFAEIARKIVRWARDLPELDLDPDVPGFLHNREADLWRPLFAIAALAGGDWPKRVTAAARRIHGERAEDEARLTLLLEAIRDEFGTSERMFTADLVSRLIQREGEPWATVKRNGAPLDAYYLRGMLRGVVERGRRPLENKRGPGRDRHFYARADFEVAWLRYIPRDLLNDPTPPVHPTPGTETPSEPPAPVASDQDEASDANPTPPTDAEFGVGLASDGDVSSDATQPLDTGEEIDADAVASDASDQKGPDANTYAGHHCGFCGAALNGGACVQHDGKLFHAAACLVEYLKRTPPA